MSAPSPCPDLDHLVGAPVEHAFLARPWGQQHVVTAGPVGGPAVVLVHGWPQHWFAWRRVIAALACDHRVIAIDVRGFGWSTSTTADGATLGTLAADVVAVTDHFDLPRVTLAGQDWGGLVGFRAVLDRPHRFDRYIALSIVPPWLRLDRLLRRFPDWAYVLPMAVAGDAVAQWPAAVRWLVRHGTGWPVWDDAGGAAALRSYVERVAEPDAAAMTRRLYTKLVLNYLPRACRRTRPARLHVPTTIMVGAHETIARPSLYWSRTYPGEIRIVTAPKARHWLSEERPDIVADVLRGLPAGLTPASGSSA